MNHEDFTAITLGYVAEQHGGTLVIKKDEFERVVDKGFIGIEVKFYTNDQEVTKDEDTVNADEIRITVKYLDGMSEDELLSMLLGSVQKGINSK